MGGVGQERNEGGSGADLGGQAGQFRGETCCRFCLRQIGVCLLHTLQSALPAGVVDIQRNRENLLGQNGGFRKDFMGIPVRVHAEGLVKHRALVIADVHGGIDSR